MSAKQKIAIAVAAVLGVAAVATFIVPEEYPSGSTGGASRSASIWDNDLLELNGKWMGSDGRQISIRLARDASILDEELVNFTNLDTSDDRYSYLRAPATEFGLNFEFNSTAPLRQRGITPPDLLRRDVEWTVRRNSERRNSRFTITIFDPTGKSVDYEYVRNLSPDEDSKYAAMAKDAPSLIQAMEEKYKASDAKFAENLERNAKFIAAICSDPVKAKGAIQMGMIERCPTESVVSPEAQPASSPPTASTEEVTQASGIKADGYDKGDYLENRFVEDRLTAEFRDCFDQAVNARTSVFGCVNAETGRHDTSLNTVYKQVMGNLAEEAKTKLRNEQREWIRARDNRCRNAKEHPTEGVDPTSVYGMCYLERTMERLIELEKMSPS